jgi:hypothetical protein
VWNVAWYDLHDGMQQLVQVFIDEVHNGFQVQRLVHAVLLVVMVRRCCDSNVCTRCRWKTRVLTDDVTLASACASHVLAN